MSTEEKVTQLEQSVAIVTRLLENHSGQLDTHTDWINQLGSGQAELRAAQAESERRIAQLVDERIRTEEALRQLAESQRRTSRQLAESQRRTDAKVFDTDARLDRLAELVERMAQNGRERPEG
jgi:septal ring factor EnvC (AmiA/AmiB activator)